MMIKIITRTSVPDCEGRHVVIQLLMVSSLTVSLKEQVYAFGDLIGPILIE